jgi:hypothetical protein
MELSVAYLLADNNTTPNFLKDTGLIWRKPKQPKRGKRMEMRKTDKILVKMSAINKRRRTRTKT